MPAATAAPSAAPTDIAVSYSPATASSWSVKEEKVGHCILTLAMREAMASSVDDDDGGGDGSNLSNTRPPLPPPLAVIPHPLVPPPDDDDAAPLLLLLLPEAISAPPLPPTSGALDDMIEMRELGAGLAGPHTGSKGNFFRESLKAERNLSAAEDDGPPPPPAELLPPLMVEK